MTDWQPIEIAPKDGTKIILWGYWAGEIYGPRDEPKFLGVGHIRSDDTLDYEDEGYLWTMDMNECYGRWAKPSHWMPLPEPPQLSRAARAAKKILRDPTKSKAAKVKRGLAMTQT